MTQTCHMMTLLAALNKSPSADSDILGEEHDRAQSPHTLILLVALSLYQVVLMLSIKAKGNTRDDCSAP